MALGGGGARAVVSCASMTGLQRAKVLVALTENMGPHEEAALSMARLARRGERARRPTSSTRCRASARWPWTSGASC